MLPDEPNEEERQEKLPQDNATPFQPASPSPDPTASADPLAQASQDSALDDTHPATDTSVQPEESYDEGVSGAAEAQEPSDGSAAADYMPPAPGTTIGPSPGQAHESSPPAEEDGSNS